MHEILDKAEYASSLKPREFSLFLVSQKYIFMTIIFIEARKVYFSCKSLRKFTNLEASRNFAAN